MTVTLHYIKINMKLNTLVANIGCKINRQIHGAFFIKRPSKADLRLLGLGLTGLEGLSPFLDPGKYDKQKPIRLFKYYNYTDWIWLMLT